MQVPRPGFGVLRSTWSPGAMKVDWQHQVAWCRCGAHLDSSQWLWRFDHRRGESWQKGNGLRIDHFLTTANITDLIKKVEVNREPRGWEKASDHTPVTITL